MLYRIIILLIISSILPAIYAADTRQVEANFNRCEQVMGRAERSLKRFDDELSILKRGISSDETRPQELQVLENRLEYFRNRIERSRGQADKIQNDLKNVSGPTCPSCVESSVNLYCRSGESLQTDIDEYLGKATSLRVSMGVQPDSVARADNEFFSVRWATADSLYRVLSLPDSCADKAGLTLLTQAHVNLVKADSLYDSRDMEKAEKTLDIARSLLEKALQRCEAKQ